VGRIETFGKNQGGGKCTTKSGNWRGPSMEVKLSATDDRIDGMLSSVAVSGLDCVAVVKIDFSK